ncbi:MAG: fatty acid desaturase [Bacteroidota bacterium]|nr:fatty acid desaturase [Bacteroidota bacterium]
MKCLSVLTDPLYIPKKKFTLYDRLWLRIINDKRDLPFIYLLTRIHVVVIITGILLYMPFWKNWIWWVAAIPYFYISQFYYKGRFGLMFHCICHRKLFKKKYHWIHTYITWVVCPFFGHSPEGYFSHHMGMHHIENNMPDDTSSTMGYQRDSLKSFLLYFFNFLTLGVRNTFLYLYNRKRKKLYIRFTMGEFLFYVFCISMCFVNLKVTLLIFIIPLFFCRLVSMLGNWTQHAFVDANDPDNAYTNSVNCINTSYNKMCWNDGYHVIHHLRPGMHYTEMPLEFLKLKEKFAINRSIVFDNLNYLHIFTYLLSGRYDKLAGNMVNINGAFMNDEDAISTLKQRTKKIVI